jgi:two-component system chemotaxis response regulator CheB
MKILIADDDAFIRIMFRKILKGTEFTLVEAMNGAEALEAMKREEFDAVITDWMMPKMDGIELILNIRQKFSDPPFILMVTAISTDEAMKKALDSGADDFITKPFFREPLLKSIRNGILRSNQGKNVSKVVAPRRDTPKHSMIGIGIASSTGGPQTLLKLFPDIPRLTNAAIFLVQHGPAWMLRSFALRLKEVTPMGVFIGEEGMRYTPGNIYIAPGDIHMVVDPNGEVLRLVDDPPENYCKPAADPLFRSIGAAFGTKAVSVVLSGMGKDGTIGSGYIAASGGTVLAQDPATAILPSMPKSIVELRIATEVHPLEKLGKALTNVVTDLSNKPKLRLYSAAR